MLTKTALLAAVLVLAACGYESEYERMVYDYDPVYCYQSIGAVLCYKEPKHSDERRMVNYYGPAPSRYDAPDRAHVPDLKPPTEEIDHWVKDAEPVVRLAKVEAPAPAPAAHAANASGGQGAERETGFWEGIRRSIFGKPQLANAPKPVPVGGTL
ncbi:MAG: hypothetical protein HN809_09880 [Rhodospirillaceae bacterium]|nr:hypothetical protein [Rhodospirillaceae bacterium]